MYGVCKRLCVDAGRRPSTAGVNYMGSLCGPQSLIEIRSAGHRAPVDGGLPALNPGRLLDVIEYAVKLVEAIVMHHKPALSARRVLDFDQRAQLGREVIL